MGSGGGPSGGGDNNRGVEKGRTKQPAVAVSKPAPRPEPRPEPRADFGVVKRKVSTVASKPKPAQKPAINEAKEARVVSFTNLRTPQTSKQLVCRLMLEKKKKSPMPSSF